MPNNDEVTTSSLDCFAKAWLHANPIGEDENVFNSHRFSLTTGETLTYTVTPVSGWVLFIKHVFVEDQLNASYRFIIGNLVYQYDSVSGETPGNEVIAMKPITVGEGDIVQVYVKNNDTVTKTYSLYVSGFARRTEHAGVKT